MKYMGSEKTYRILIGGGGTGGHVFPAIAIADALRERYPQASFLFVGARGKLEMEKVPEAGYRIEGLPVAGFQRKLTLRNVSFFFKLAASMRISSRIIRKFRPRVAIGVGGYASGPILKAAARKGVPVVIQEQNSYAGITNRLLARSARTICVAYEGMDRYFPSERIVITGNPVRKQLLDPGPGREKALKRLGFREDRNLCLVVGGSLGARTLNRSMLKGLESLEENGLQVLWQCGRLYYEQLKEAVDPEKYPGIKLQPFIREMDLAYAAADIVVSRAGAISISELCLVGKAVILVPSPNVAEDHQTSNARALVSRNAALMVADMDAEAILVETILGLVKDEAKRKFLGENIKKMGIGDSSERIAAEVGKILESG